ncbi:hypothetical protein [Aerococcus urinae]
MYSRYSSKVVAPIQCNSPRANIGFKRFPASIAPSAFFLGNQMLFTTWDELKEQWRIADSIKEAWSQLDPPSFPNYPAMTKGPEAAKDLIESDGRRWINPQY